MKGLETVKHLIEANDFMVKIDLKDTYLFVPICEEKQNFSVSVGKGGSINSFVYSLASWQPQESLLNFLNEL